MIKKIILLGALVFPLAVFAEENTSEPAPAVETQNAPEAEPAQQEPIYIESDSLDIDDSKGVSIYSGNVHFRQGTADVWADVITIYSEKRKEVEKIIAEGKPARFIQNARNVDEEDSSGEALLIEYYANQALVILDGEARFQQGDNSFAGNRVEFKTDERIVRAGKSVADQGRVQIVIQPRNTNGEAPQ